MFFSLDCAAGVGPEVDAPRFGFPAVALAGSAVLVAEGLSAAVEIAGGKEKGLEDDVGAAVSDGLLKADVPVTASAGFSVALPILENISVDDVEGEASAELDELAF